MKTFSFKLFSKPIDFLMSVRASKLSLHANIRGFEKYKIGNWPNTSFLIAIVVFAALTRMNFFDETSARKKHPSKYGFAAFSGLNENEISLFSWSIEYPLKTEPFEDMHDLASRVTKKPFY